MGEIQRRRRPPPPFPRYEFVSFCCVKCVEITLEINLYELIMPFEHCILQAERLGFGDIV
jgi:hypothetical protein